ncbi:MAG: ribosome small subunit-dependent GTPase A [Chitinivibrionia bacterium]|nr:ribosome small subunit-dependent GTPase A [Chitinivibrionia bacterium]
MELTNLGFDEWFERHSAALLKPGRRIARVTAVDRGAFLVRNQDAETYAELAGRLRFAAQSAIDLPCVGDWVGVQYHMSGGPAIIHCVMPRKTCLRRKCPGKTADFQMIAANIDVALIVQACEYDFNMRRLDRYLVMANEGHIEPRIVMSKTDLISPAELEGIIAQIKSTGISTQVLALSNTTGFGLDSIRRILSPGKTYCLLGSSGVGKTTLINRLIGREVFDTKEVSGTGEGVHTTARRQLISLECGALLIDTPGMRELGLLGATAGVNEAFADFHELSLNCRFSDCTHTQEPDCAVLAAVESGNVSEERYHSYLKLRKEIAFHDLTYIEKRKKDKVFGRFIKSAKKQIEQ